MLLRKTFWVIFLLFQSLSGFSQYGLSVSGSDAGSSGYGNENASIVVALTDNVSVPLSALNMNKTGQREAAMKVLLYYGAKAGILPPLKLGISPHTSSREVLAFTRDQSVILITAEGGINPLLNNYNNLISTLIHEKLHTEERAPKEGYRYMDHVRVYTDQITDITFKSTDLLYKASIVASYIGYLRGALENNEIDAKGFDQSIECIRTLVPDVKITNEHWGCGLVNNVFATDGKNIYSKDVETKSDPH